MGYQQGVSVCLYIYLNSITWILYIFMKESSILTGFSVVSILFRAISIFERNICRFDFTVLFLVDSNANTNSLCTNSILKKTQ